MNRRELFRGTCGALGAGLVRRSVAENTSSAVPAAPVARVDVVKDSYFGESLSDPYRWMENDQDPDWLPFLKGQNAHTHAVLERIPGRAALLERIQALTGDTALTRTVQRAGQRLFYEQRPAAADNFKLFVRQGETVRVLVDPTLKSTTSSHLSLDWWRASEDGARVVYGLSKDGSENSILHVLDVADGRDLAEQIPETENAEPHWLDDGSGFFYNQLTGKVDTPERYLDSIARFHRLGTDPAKDPVIMRRGQDPRVRFDRIQMPHVVTFAGSRYALLALRDVRSEMRLLIAPVADVISGRAQWVPVADFDDEVTAAELDGDTIYLLANRGHPRGRILKSAAAKPAVAQASEIVPQSQWVIEDIHLARDGLYLVMLDGGVSRLKRLGSNERLVDIALPFDGSIAVFTTVHALEGALFSLAGWLTPADVWAVDGALKLAPTHLTPAPAIDVSSYETKRLFATVRDGTKVPYDLIYRKGLRLDGTTPAWINAYGSYGLVAYPPAFAAKTLALIDAGFLVGYAHVRGGGEYGRDWHRAGQLENKPNTWGDLIDVCLDLCARKYTAPARLAIGGRSAGGITVGRALTERPELFAAVIDGVGWSNPLRYVAEPNGYGEEPEWGRIDEKAGYQALKAIDSYQAVRTGVAYPAVLLTTGVTDPRVGPFHAAKMTARLQACTSSDKPILLRVDFDAGHGVGSTRAQQDRESADTYAFLLWQTGVKAYQPG